MLKKIIASVVILFTANLASAAILDLTGSIGAGTPAFTTVATDGTLVTFSNVIQEGSGTNFFNSAGLALGSGGLGYQWDVVFSQSITFNTIRFSSVITNLGFNISGPGVSATDLFVGVNGGMTTYAMPSITFIGNETYTFTSNNLCPSCGGIEIAEFGFEQVSVPAPASVAVMLVALLGAGFWRQKQI
ncbi:MAG: hypothetical protein ACFHX7_14485 [Pseudomonadota bacterium]